MILSRASIHYHVETLALKSCRFDDFKESITLSQLILNYYSINGNYNELASKVCIVKTCMRTS